MAYRKPIEKKTNYGLIIGVVIIVIVIVAAAVAVVFLNSSETQGDEAKVRENVQDVYELLTDQNVEILAVEYQNGLYKVIIQTMDIQGNPETQILFVSKDGKLLTDRMVDLESYKTGLQTEKNFIDCLFDSGVRVVGLSNNTGSALQVQSLGNFGYKLYFDCGEENLQICQDIGVQTVPSVIYNNTIYEGLKEPQWFVDTVGCTI